ncbi:hypothetical protein SMF913_11552 [Streptomyces malaysiensis]|uniref:Uncharacterized protein n=1 Tax=Streptomyces malaysiensis TaxID=92644 RepID=A0A2J7Z5H8_STRMQ|nr:hypothetical protein [Streptomyces malaysiensis]PNG95527.1 hypothetical protein SMF913_11552 [Streptomyces malaysiensis]
MPDWKVSGDPHQGVDSGISAAEQQRRKASSPVRRLRRASEWWCPGGSSAMAGGRGRFRFGPDRFTSTITA